MDKNLPHVSTEERLKFMQEMEEDNKFWTTDKIAGGVVVLGWLIFVLLYIFFKN